MTERQRPELSYEEQIKSTYNTFAKLTRKHGVVSSESGGLLTNAQTLSVSIPSDKNPHKHPDFVSGKNFGTGLIEIFYRKGYEAGQIALSKVDRKITFKKVALLKPHYSKTGISYERDRNEQDNGEGAKSNMHVIIELLDKAGKILRGEEVPHVEVIPLPEGQKRIKKDQAIKLARALAAQRDRLVREREEELRKKKRSNRSKNSRKNLINLPINSDNQLPEA